MEKIILNNKDFSALEKHLGEKTPPSPELQKLLSIAPLIERNTLGYQTILDTVYNEVQQYIGQGNVAKYIPALAIADPKDFAMSISLLNGDNYHVGQSDKMFSIQSISKIFLFELLLYSVPCEQWNKRVRVEPSGSSFNSLVQLEYESGIPRNPFINPGAIVVSDILMDRYKDETVEKLLFFLSATDGGVQMKIDPSILKSEQMTGFRNTALINLMKSFKNINNDIDKVLNVYFSACSIMSNTNLLSRSMLHLANSGVDPINNNRLLSDEDARRVNALMLTCGHYDASGEFAFRVGLPGKSGVGGGIVAVVPNKMSIAVYSPGLNAQGNSLVGTKALEVFTKLAKFSVF